MLSFDIWIENYYEEKLNLVCCVHILAYLSCICIINMVCTEFDLLISPL